MPYKFCRLNGDSSGAKKEEGGTSCVNGGEAKAMENGAGQDSENSSESGEGSKEASEAEDSKDGMESNGTELKGRWIVPYPTKIDIH
jgi:hypothetical protein